MPTRTFTGTSNHGNQEEALKNAIENAFQTYESPDLLIQWELIKVEGEYGGVSGVNNLTVTISVSD